MKKEGKRDCLMLTLVIRVLIVVRVTCVFICSSLANPTCRHCCIQKKRNYIIYTYIGESRCSVNKLIIKISFFSVEFLFFFIAISTTTRSLAQGVCFACKKERRRRTLIQFMIMHHYSSSSYSSPR